MNKESLQHLAMGAALVLLAYAAYSHFKTPAPAAKAAPRNTGVVGPMPMPMPSRLTEEQPEYTGSPFTRLDDLLTGTTTDIGSFQGKNYLDDMENDYTESPLSSVVLPGRMQW